MSYEFINFKSNSQLFLKVKYKVIDLNIFII
jgi:hypothetical protein